MLTVIAKFRARKDKVEETKRILGDLVVPSLLEEGCLQYDLHQCKDEPHTFFLYENWADDICLERHLNYYRSDFHEESKGFLQSPMEIFLLARI